MNVPTFDLVEIVKVTQRNLKVILGLTITAAILATISYKVSDKNYKAEAEVYMLNPLFGDRNHLMRRPIGDVRFVDYFGTEGDVDRGMTMIESRGVEDSVIKAADLFTAYKLDPQKAKDRGLMHDRYRSSFEAKRTENASIMCFYKDVDPARSAKVLDLIVSITDFKFREYLSVVKNNSEERVVKKINNMTEEINIYTDSLIKLRNQYQIFDLISPNRNNTQIGNLSAAGKVNAAEGIEKIQNLEALKDQLVIARADLQSTATELKTDKSDEVKMFYYVSPPTEPNKPHGIGFVLTVISAALATFFFSVLLFSLTQYIKALANTNRA